MKKARFGAGPYTKVCKCPVPDGRLWCYRCEGSAKMTAAEARYLLSHADQPPAGGGVARPVSRGQSRSPA